MNQAESEAGAAAEPAFSLLQWGITPWTVLVLCLVPLLLLMRYRKVFPTPRLAMLTAVVPLLALPLPFLPEWWWGIVAISGAVVAILACVDLLTLPDPAAISISRSMPKVASLGNFHEAKFQIDNRSDRTMQLTLAEDATEGLQVEPTKHQLLLHPQKRHEVKHRITPNRRGAYRLEFADSLLASQGGLWCKQVQFDCASDLHVYPDIKQLSKYALLARTNRLSQIGIRRTRRAGQDNNFERLRDYQQDDNYKHIDWRTTARRQKLTTRQFQTDQSQRIIFLLDCGRMMTNEYQQLSLLDYSLNAALMLSYVALDQGDSVGMISFSDQVHAYVPPHSGKRQMNRLLHAGFNQFPRLVQSRFDEAFLYLSHHCRRRSLVVLITNVVDQVNADQIEGYLQNLVGGHVPLLVLLRDHSIFQAADHPTPDPTVMYRSAAASQLLVWRNQVVRGMRARGAVTLDVFPDQMTSPMINQYLAIKAQHLL